MPPIGMFYFMIIMNYNSCRRYDDDDDANGNDELMRDVDERSGDNEDDDRWNVSPALVGCKWDNVQEFAYFSTDDDDNGDDDDDNGDDDDDNGDDDDGMFPLIWL